MKLTRRRFLTGAALGIAALAGYGALRIRRRLRRVPAIYGGPAGTIADLRDSTPFDVCIVGSGPAGAVLGMELARAGARTMIVESGANLPEVAADRRYEELDVYTSSGALDYPLSATRVRELGGAGNVWTGRCSRLHPLDFERNAYTPPGAGWPIGYDEIEPWYVRAERTLRVRGGELSGYHAPRSAALPLPASLDISGLKAQLARVGIVVDDSPTSTSGLGDGPVRVANELLPAYSRAPAASLLKGVTATRLVTERNERITGLEVTTLDRETAVVRARSYVVAGGAVESARLLLNSASEAMPDGPGNAYDQVGRHFTEHPNLLFSGMIEHDWSTLSPQYELGRCHQFYDAFKREGYGSTLLSFIQSWVFREDLSGWSAAQVAERARELAGRLARARLRIGATIEMEPRPGNRVRLSGGVRDYFGQPAADIALAYSERDRATMDRVRDTVREIYDSLGATDVAETGSSWSHHHLGTCRMGDDPRTSVVDRDLRVHGLENLHVLGSAVFVTGGAAHPTLLIAALAHRLAAELQGALTDGRLAASV